MEGTCNTCTFYVTLPYQNKFNCVFWDIAYNGVGIKWTLSQLCIRGWGWLQPDQKQKVWSKCHRPQSYCWFARPKGRKYHHVCSYFRAWCPNPYPPYRTIQHPSSTLRRVWLQTCILRLAFSDLQSQTLALPLVTSVFFILFYLLITFCLNLSSFYNSSQVVKTRKKKQNYEVTCTLSYLRRHLQSTQIVCVASGDKTLWWLND